MLQAELQWWPSSLAEKMGTSFIISTGCSFSEVPLSFQNSSWKLAKLHLLLPQPVTQLPPANFPAPPHPASPTVVWDVGPSFSCHPLHTMASPWKMANCQSPHSVTILLSSGSCICHVLMVAGWKSISKPEGVSAISTQNSHPRPAPWSFQKAAKINGSKIIRLPRGSRMVKAMLWQKLTTARASLVSCGFLWHMPPSKTKIQAKSCSLCYGSSGYFHVEKNISSYVQKKKQ